MAITLHWDETPEEKSKRIDEILRLNSKEPQICVTCLELISDNETAVIGSAGPYHGAPRDCVEGRKDENIPWHQK